MKVLWFTSSPVLGYSDNVSGSWTYSMYNALSRLEGIDIINIVISHGLNQGPALGNTVIIESNTKNRQRPGRELIELFREVVSKIKPDLIHIWGTEWNGSYITVMANLGIPVLVSIQGITASVRKHLSGNRKTIEILRWLTIHDLIAPSGLMSIYRDLKRTSTMEFKAIEQLHYFECATPFMEAWVRSVNNKAEVFQCNSILRPVFYKFRWSESSMQNHSLFLPDAFMSYKGFDVMLKSAEILIKEFPYLQIRVAGVVPRKGFFEASGYERFMHSIIKKKNLESKIVFLGPLKSDRLCHEMLSSHCVVISSFIESQSLILLESMMLGVPTIASYAGGMPDLFTNMQTALGYPAGDHISLAHRVRSLFNNQNLANQISSNAYNLAHKRNEQLSCAEGMANIYRTVLHKIN